jgi:hypothetical protein
MKNKIVLFVIAGLLLLALLGTSCSGTQGQNISGKWVPDTTQNSPKYSSLSLVNSLEFLKDGTFIVSAELGINGSGRYTFIDETHISFQSPSGSNTYVFTLSGDKLSLQEPDGAITQFTRSNESSSSNKTSGQRAFSNQESEALATAIDAWAGLLDSDQEGDWYYMKTRLVNCNRSSLKQELEKGNTVTVQLTSIRKDSSDCYIIEIQIREFRSDVHNSSLSEADKANGITWQGEVHFAYMTRFRAINAKGIQNPAEISSFSDQQPFCPWKNVALVETDKKILDSPASVLVRKQNGRWTTPVIFGGAPKTGDSLNVPIPGLLDLLKQPEYNKEPYTITLKSEDQQVPDPASKATPSLPAAATTSAANPSLPPPATTMIADAMIKDVYLEMLSSYDDIPQAYHTSKSGYSKLDWSYGSQLATTDAINVIKIDGKYTQMDDGAGNYPGECVSFVKSLTDTSEVNTSSWIKGKRVMDGGIQPGTVIATFMLEGGKKFDPGGNSHTAIFKGYLEDGSGFEVWDQNWDFKGVIGTHPIVINGSKKDPNTIANNYYVVHYGTMIR